MIAGLPLAVSAQNFDPNDTIPDGFGHSGTGDLPNKRIETTGSGWFSLRGPYDDTENMTWLGQITNAEMQLQKITEFNAPYMSDIWGWSSRKHDYALVGTSSGIVFVRVTDPTKPEFLGLAPTTNLDTIRNFWWDIKTYKNYAYWTTEVNNAGVGIYDLSHLDDKVAVEPGTDDAVLEVTARWRPNGEDGYRRAHNIAINEESGRAYLIGVTQAGLSDDAIMILDLTGDPENPEEIGSIQTESDNGFGGVMDAHDAQIVTYAGKGKKGSREILFNYNGNAQNVQIWDVTDAESPVHVSTTSYPGATFAHQGWLTEDRRHILVGDEADEEVGLQQPNNTNLPDTARTYILNVNDLNNPYFVGVYDSPAETIDHNLFVMGDKVYQANYIAGVRVLQINDEPGGEISLEEIAHMDTEPRIPNKITWNVNRFIGPWGVFPFFDNGTIIASDGLNGLVVMRLGEE